MFYVNIFSHSDQESFSKDVFFFFGLERITAVFNQDYSIFLNNT